MLFINTARHIIDNERTSFLCRLKDFLLVDPASTERVYDSRVPVFDAVHLLPKRRAPALGDEEGVSQAKRPRRSLNSASNGASGLPTQYTLGQPLQCSADILFTSSADVITVSDAPSPCASARKPYDPCTASRASGTATSSPPSSPGVLIPDPWRRASRRPASKTERHTRKAGESLSSNKGGGNASTPARTRAAGVVKSEAGKAVSRSADTRSHTSAAPSRNRTVPGLRNAQPPAVLTTEHVSAVVGLPCGHDACTYLSRNLQSANDQVVGLLRDLDASRKEAARASSLEAKVTCGYIVNEDMAYVADVSNSGLEARIEHGKRMFNKRGDALLGMSMLCTALRFERSRSLIQARDAVISEQAATNRGLRATVDRMLSHVFPCSWIKCTERLRRVLGLSDKMNVLIREIQELAPEGYGEWPISWYSVAQCTHRAMQTLTGLVAS